MIVIHIRSELQHDVVAIREHIGVHRPATHPQGSHSYARQSAQPTDRRVHRNDSWEAFTPVVPIFPGCWRDGFLQAAADQLISKQTHLAARIAVIQPGVSFQLRGNPAASFVRAGIGSYLMSHRDTTSSNTAELSPKAFSLLAF
jgi:hypothetical protein